MTRFAAWVLWLGVAVLITAHLLLGAWSWDVGVQRFVSALQPLSGPPPNPRAKRVFLDNDPYCWLTYAQQMIEHGTWRVRWTDFDNVPVGRAVHWSQSVSWCLVGLGGMIRWLTGAGWWEALETAAVWLNPVLLVLWTATTGWVIAVRLGVVPAAIWMLTMATLPDVHWSFHPLRPDHQTFHWMFAWGTAIAITFGGLGWVQPAGGSPRGWTWWCAWTPPTRRAARGWFVAAGLLTGLGLWTGATVQFFAVGAVAAGALGLAALMPARAGTGETNGCAYEPGLWRWWSVTGAITALAMYAVEYAPRGWAMRLEVNHPFYALALWGVGEAMLVLTRQRVQGGALSARQWRMLIASVTAIAAVPVAVMLGGSDWHRMREPLMSRMHEFISEFYSWPRFAGGSVWGRWWEGYGVLPLFALGALWLAGSRRLRVQEWAALWLAFFLSWFFLALLFWQVRWAGGYALGAAWVTVWVVYGLGRLAEVSQHRYWRTVAGVASLAVVVQTIWFAANQQKWLRELRSGRVWDEGLVDAVMKKHLAEGMAAISDAAALRVLCEADLGPALFYFGGIRSVTTFYWENLDGLHAATTILAAREDEPARQVVRQRGLTHVVVSTDTRLPRVFDYLASGRRDASGRGTLLERLQRGGMAIPDWIRLDARLTAVGRREFGHPGLGRGRSVEGHMLVYEFLDNRNRVSVTER